MTKSLTSNEDRWLNSRQAAQYIGIAQQTLYNKLGEEGNDIPFVRVGRSLRFRKSELDRWVFEKAGEAELRATESAA